MAKNKERCAVCLFLKHESGVGEMVCHNEKSENYGKAIPFAQYREWKCDDFAPHRYGEMAVKEALDIVTGTGNNRHMLYADLKTPEKESDHAFITLVFDTNKQAERWRDAFARLFFALIEMKKKDGDFDEPD